MRTRRVRFASGTNRWAHDLYLRAFPEDERLPWALIHLLSLRRGIDLVAWWDQPAGPPRAASPDPVALTWTVRRPGSRLLYLFYLAVDDAARGRGVGTRLLADLVSAVGQDEGQSLAQKDGVISDQNAHGIIASTVVGPPVGDVIVSLPSTPLRRSTRPARP